jgi:hypothetical protein
MNHIIPLHRSFTRKPAQSPDETPNISNSNHKVLSSRSPPTSTTVATFHLYIALTLALVSPSATTERCMPQVILATLKPGLSTIGPPSNSGQRLGKPSNNFTTTLVHAIVSQERGVRTCRHYVLSRTIPFWNRFNVLGPATQSD